MIMVLLAAKQIQMIIQIKKNQLVLVFESFLFRSAGTKETNLCS